MKICRTRPSIASLFGLLGMLGVLAPPAIARDDPATATLTIEVLDQRDDAPIAGATVEMDGNMDRTDANGQVRVPFRARNHRLQLNVEFEDFFPVRRSLRRQEQLDLSAGNQPLTIRLKPFDRIELIFYLRRQTGGRLRADGTLTLLGRDYPITKGRAEISLDRDAALARQILLGSTPAVRVAVPGFDPIEFKLQVREIGEIYRRSFHPQPLTLPVALTRSADSGRIVLRIEARDATSGGLLDRPARVAVDGFGRQTTGNGRVRLEFERNKLARFRDRFSEQLDIRIEADGYHGPVTSQVPVADLLDALDRGESELTQTVSLRPIANAPALDINVAPSSAVRVRDERIGFQYRIANRGNVALDGITLADPHCHPVNRLSGDDDGDNQLDVGEAWLFECMAVADRGRSFLVEASARSPDGTRVQASAPVWLVVNDCPAGERKMPELTGMPLHSAQALLERIGLESITVIEAETDAVDADTVLDQQPAADACITPDTGLLLTVARPPQPTDEDARGPIEAMLDCPDGLEITAGARPSRTCGVIVRNWAWSDEHVRLAVSLPPGTALDVWPMNDAAWPPNMHIPGVADMRFRERYIFTLMFSAPITATPGLVPVGIMVSQPGNGRVNLSLDVSILPPGRMPSQGSGIRPPPEPATGSGGEFCVWRSKSFGDPPKCFLFNIAACGTAAYDGNARYEREGSDMTKLEASVLMSRLSRYGGDAYGCLAQLNPPEPDDPPTDPPETRTCPDGSSVPTGQPCPQPTRTCPDGSTVAQGRPCPPETEPEPTQTCPDGSVIDADENCPAPDDGQTGGDCSSYGPHAELYWDADAQEHLCRCRPGYRFHASDRCVPEAEISQCLNYPGTFPDNGVCQCATPGHYWSELAGRCLPPDDFPEQELADCSAYPGSLPLPDPATGEIQCSCPVGLSWSDDLNRCATATEEQVAGINCSHRPGTVREIDYFENRAVCRCPDNDQQWDIGSGACVSTQGPGGGGIGDDPDPPTPTTVQTGQCDDTARQGSDDAVRVQIEIAGATQLGLTYDTLRKEDRVRAFIDGSLVHDSGCLGTRGDVTESITPPAGARMMEVDVYPNCTGGTGTQWSFTVDCSVGP